MRDEVLHDSPSPQEDVAPALASVPGEVLRDILLPLNRWTLDGVQFTTRRFLQLILEHMTDVCLRQVNLAGFLAPSGYENMDGTAFIQIDGRPRWKINHTDATHLSTKFVQALRSSHVTTMTLHGFVFTSELADLVLQTSIVTDALHFDTASCVELSPTQFHEVVRHFLPTSLDTISCRLRECHITDEFLRALTKNRVRRLTFRNRAPVDGVSFRVTDDIIVDFCVQEDVPTVEAAGAASKQRLYGELIVCNGRFTKHLFKRLVEASAASMRTQPLHIDVSPVCVDDEDLRDFAPYLWYRYRGQAREFRVYDFPGEQHGVADAMHLQIVLRPNDTLEMIRAQRPNPLFLKSGE